MSDLNIRFPLDLDSPRFSIRKPEVRSDRQGDMPDAERVDRAMQSFMKDFSTTTATYMESCIHCGHCADACHFYKVTGDPKYTPIWKLEPFKQTYKREAGPFAFAYRAFNLKPKVTLAELEEWQHLLYDACTMCGRWLEDVAIVEKKMPRDFITPDGFHITAKCRRYLEPLVAGEAFPPFEKGLPRYVRLKNPAVRRKTKTAFKP